MTTKRHNPHNMRTHIARPAIVLLGGIFLAACNGGSNDAGGNDGPAVKLRNFQQADIVIGQADFTGGEDNQGGTADANTLYRPSGSLLVDSTLFIADSRNNRVLGFNALPSVNNRPADFVFGQPDFTSDADGTTREKMDRPQQIAVANGKMAIADSFNRRVLFYDSIPADGSARPDVVIGQADFTSKRTACSQDGLRFATAAEITNDGKLIVADFDNQRVLIWTSLPTSNGQPADLVLGQADFTHCESNDDDQDGTADAAPTARTLEAPSGLWSDGTRLVVNDSRNNRTLIWNSFPTANFQPADIVLGQGDFTHNASNDDDQDGTRDSDPSNRTLSLPGIGVDSNGTQLAIADELNHRVLVWNRFPTANFQPADVVLGQGDFAHDTANDDDQDGIPDSAATARTLRGPASVRFTNNGLLVTDSRNNRVLIYRSQ